MTAKSRTIAPKCLYCGKPAIMRYGKAWFCSPCQRKAYEAHVKANPPRFDRNKGK